MTNMVAPTSDRPPALLKVRGLTAGALIVAAAGAAIAASIIAAPGLGGWFGAALALLMLAIAAVDFRRFIIPDSLNAVGLALGLVCSATLGAGEAVGALAAAAVRAAVLAAVFYALRALYARLRGRDGIGLGDVKLAAVAGAWLDWSIMPIAVEIAAVSALCAYGIRQYLSRRPLRASNLLPFGLFLAPAIWICWLLQATVLANW